MALKTVARSLFRRAGLDLVRWPGNAPGPALARLLEHRGITVVFDVGANQGQYGRQLRAAGYRGRIVSFEPTTDAYRLLSAAAADDARWETINAAIGRSAGVAEINVAANHGESSSLLPMLDAHVEAAPHAQYVATESVTVVALDDVWRDHCSPGDRAFLKADVQGYELEVLDGAPSLVTEAVGMQLEMSLVPLYEGGPLYLDIIDVAQRNGMELELVIPGHQHPTTGRMVQMDGVFFRGP